MLKPKLELIKPTALNQKRFAHLCFAGHYQRASWFWSKEDDNACAYGEAKKGYEKRTDPKLLINLTAGPFVPHIMSLQGLIIFLHSMIIPRCFELLLDVKDTHQNCMI